jgi:hypothetical protein
MKRIIAFLLSFIVLFSIPAAANAKYEIAGRNCKTPGTFRTIGDVTYFCVSTSKRGKRWTLFSVATTTTTTTTTTVSYPYGSYQNPVQKGVLATYQVGGKPTLEITIHNSDFNVMNFICSSNMFNDGCDSSTRAPASYSPDRWVRVDLTIKNVSTALIDVFWEYSWSAVLQGRHYGEFNSAAGVDDLGDVDFLPGAQITTSVYILVPKMAGAADLMFAFRHTSVNTWAYFRA